MAETTPNLSSIEPSTFEPLAEGTHKQRRGGSPWRWPLLAVILVFVAIMTFVLTARSIQISVEAESEVDIALSGGLYLPFGDRYLLRSGNYRVRVTAPGYHPLESPVNVTAESTQVIQLVLRPLPGQLDVSSQPGGASVFVDGELKGLTPLLDESLEAGQHHLLIELARYLPVEQELSIHGREIQQQLVIPLEPAWAEISVDSKPRGATILVDGEILGSTPAMVEILQGPRQLVLRKDTFNDRQEELEINAGETVDLGVLSLQPSAGTFRITSAPSQANVTLDGEFRGQTPLTLEVSPDQRHLLAVYKPGYRQYTNGLELAAGATGDRHVTLKPQLGEVHFNIEPQQAMLKINGRPLGTGSRTLELPAAEHSIEIVLEGYASIYRRITPRPGMEQALNITLLTELEAKLARMKPELTTSLGQTLLLFTPGDFTMGSSRREPGRRTNELLHPVSLKRMFYLQTTEVTNAEFRQFQAIHLSGQVEGNSLNREFQPVVQISWQQAAQFCNWLSRKENLQPFYKESKGIVVGHNSSAKGYRLPTEAEWAWAARVEGETILKFPWGDTFPPVETVENYADSDSAHITGRVLNNYMDGHVVSAVVATFSPNNKGLYDMGGNVAEWVNDVYIMTVDANVRQIDPTGAQSGDNYTIRGSSWAHSKIADLRLSFRDYGQAGRDDVGFRIARYAE